MHYSRTMPRSGNHRYFTSTAVLLNELIKLAVSLTFSMYESSKTLAPNTPVTVLIEQIYNSVFAGDGWKLSILAAFYTIQNLLQYMAVGNLDAVQFQVLYQLKILTTAVFSVVLLRRSLGPKRWLSLLILTLGVCVVSMPSLGGDDPVYLREPTDHFFSRPLHDLAEASPELYQPRQHLQRRSATYEGITEDLAPPEPLMNYSVGVTCVLIAASVSGLTGVYFEKLLKDSPTQTSVWIRNVQLSFYSLIAAALGGVMWQDWEGIREHGFFEGYNWAVWLAIFLQAASGMVASIVIRDADNIVKNFATSISIVISFLASMCIFEFNVTWTFLCGTGLVLAATYLYNAPDHKIPAFVANRPKPIRVVSLEKPAIAPMGTPRLTPRGTPRLTPRLGSSTPDLDGVNGAGGRLHYEPLDSGKGLGLSSGLPNSPMLPRTPSRGDFQWS
ncbi:solute carrier family 35 (UDP-sugar transporter), member A1/2/3 [Geosmithia morbida]|uniref:Solute carrier family 35 (UDP-sugar transporter), member A1/2/3 n=1 Tax=Geosmithia morbida TaxID=1094350 RepID=A0A9P5D4E5_9HYPO|nr:solute carrier family 35 (UDP-sugar transporter), member A1/2/3 [Geosmithia morbida]KAF4121414.1 solute carrier family 35 (UDP-sugar transporter), member A1/2/3 [Geosmithia morbida]